MEKYNDNYYNVKSGRPGSLRNLTGEARQRRLKEWDDYRIEEARMRQLFQSELIVEEGFDPNDPQAIKLVDRLMQDKGWLDTIATFSDYSFLLERPKPTTALGKILDNLHVVQDLRPGDNKQWQKSHLFGMVSFAGANFHVELIELSNEGHQDTKLKGMSEYFNEIYNALTNEGKWATVRHNNRDYALLIYPAS